MRKEYPTLEVDDKIACITDQLYFGKITSIEHNGISQKIYRILWNHRSMCDPLPYNDYQLWGNLNCARICGRK